MAETFGELLREHRIAAGLSMGQLAKLIHYSKGYLSKIENDVKPPTPAVARLCDGVLDVGGRLSRPRRKAGPRWVAGRCWWWARCSVSGRSRAAGRDRCRTSR
jgi:transcriptional regulator with XRE-family HTH domain